MLIAEAEATIWSSQPGGVTSVSGGGGEGTGEEGKGRMAKLPKAFETFRKRYRSVYEAYETLGGAAHGAGPLDQKTRELVKLGMAIGGRLEGAVRSHVHRALEAGATPEEIEHVVLLAVTTSGFHRRGGLHLGGGSAQPPEAGDGQRPPSQVGARMTGFPGTRPAGPAGRSAKL